MLCARHVLIPLFVLPFILSCQSERELRELELRKSLKTYLEAIEKLDTVALEASVYFPKVSDYKEHVSELLLDYLDKGQKGEPVSFDPQGVVLGRFLGLLYHSYEITDLELSGDGRDAKMKIAINFSYDNNITYSYRAVDYDPGTKILIPGSPFGHVNVIVLGTENPVPREQLRHIDIEIEFRKTNYEGLWQVRRCEAIPGSMEWETSIKERFDY